MNRAAMLTVCLGFIYFANAKCMEVQCRASDITCNTGIAVPYFAYVSTVCAQLDWKDTRANCWPLFSAALQSAQAAGDCGAPTVNLIGNTFGTTQKWSSGVLATNGRVYGVVQNTGQFLQIDPTAGTAAPVAPTIAPLNGWRGGVLAHNEKIYGFPSSTNLAILEFDPIGLSTNQFYTGTGAGNSMRGGVVAPNGMIYSVPRSHTAVLKIDPANQTVTELPAGGVGWIGAVLGPTGLIYGVPNTSTDILVIDPADDSIRKIPTGNQGYNSGVLAPNGLIYLIPASPTNVLVFDPFTETVSTFGSVAGGIEQWVGGALAPNGKIYAPPGSGGADTTLVIDTLTNTLSTIPTGLGAGRRWWGAVAADNGRVYAIPFDGTRVLEIDTCSNARLDRNVLLSGFFNKF